MDISKKIQLIVFAAAVMVLTALGLFWDSICLSLGCTYEIRNSYLRPLYELSICISIVVTVFLVLPVSYWKRWLKYVASWYLPIGFVIVAGIDPLSSNLLNPTRAQMVEILGYGLMALTVLSVGHSYLKSRRAN